MTLSYERRANRRAPRRADPSDPISIAISLLAHSRHKQALMQAIEERVKSGPEERRYFGAAAGRVYGLSGQAAFDRALRNYLDDLRKPAAAERTPTLVFIAKVVADIQDRQPNPTLDPHAAAEALFRKSA